MKSKFDKLCFQLLRESPDSSSDADGNILHYDDENSISFLIHIKTGDYVWAKSSIALHSDLVYFSLTDQWDELGGDSEGPDPRGELFDYRLGVDAFMDMGEDCPDDNRTLNGTFIGGRLWPENNVISFWNTEDVVMRSISHVKKFMSIFGVEPKNTLFDFIDRVSSFTPKEFLSKEVKDKINAEDEELLNQLFDDGKEGGSKDTDKLSDEEVQKLLQLQHLNPEAKKILRKKAGYQKSKLPFGWNVYSRFSESTERI